jgi:hypothetical protein
MIPIEYPFSEGLSSMLFTTLPLISEKAGRLPLLRERVPLLSAIVASYQVLWLGAFPGLNHRERPAQVMADFWLENKGQEIQTAPLPFAGAFQLWSAIFTFSFPVAAKMALAIAGATGGTAVSPKPPGISEPCRKCRRSGVRSFNRMRTGWKSFGQQAQASTSPESHPRQRKCTLLLGISN